MKILSSYLKKYSFWFNFENENLRLKDRTQQPVIPGELNSYNNI